MKTTADDFLVVAPAFYPDITPVEYLVESARTHNIPLKLYGLGEPFKDWIDTHLLRLHSELQLTTKSHFLFTDASDCFFVRPMEEIVRAYNRLGAPPLLVAWEKSGLNAGGFIGDTQWMLDCIEFCLRFAEGIPQAGDPQERWRSCYTQVNNGMIQLDQGCQIFQVMSDEVDLEFLDQRLTNMETYQRPCILHFAGGYNDPTHGRKERMKQWFDKLYGGE